MGTRVVVIGGTGRIGSRVVANLHERGYDVVAASPKSGVNSVTGEGLEETLRGTSVLVDVSNSASFEEKPAMDFFRASTGNLAAQAKRAGVEHFVALSVVGTDRLQEIPYFRAKLMQEQMIKESSIPYSIVRATQFYEFVGGIADSATAEGVVRLPPVAFQPIAADDVAAAVAHTAAGRPLNGMLDTAGPRRSTLDEVVRDYLRFHNDTRKVITDPAARYFGGEMRGGMLVPSGAAFLGQVKLEDWLKSATASA